MFPTEAIRRVGWSFKFRIPVGTLVSFPPGGQLNPATDRLLNLMNRSRITRVGFCLLVCCVTLSSPDRTWATGGAMDSIRSDSILMGDYLLAANLSESGFDLAENPPAAQETTDQPADPSGSQESEATTIPPSYRTSAPPLQPPSRSTVPPDGASNPLLANPTETLPPQDLPLPPKPMDAPESPQEPAVPQEATVPQEEAQDVKPFTGHTPSVGPVAPADSPLFGTEAMTQFTSDSLNMGKWGFHPHFGLSTVNDSNVFIQSTNQESGFITTVAVGATLLVGNAESPLSLTVDYTVAAVLFLEQSSLNTINQNASLGLRWTLPKLTLTLRGAVSAGTGTSVDIGNRVTLDGFTFGLGASYELTAKTFLTADLTENLSSYAGGIGSSVTWLNGYFNYQFRPKLTIGLGGGIGYTSVQDAGDQISEQISLRANYAATAKLSINGNLGVQRIEYSGGMHSSPIPVFGLGATWNAREGTQISLNASRSVTNSAGLAGQNFVTTGANLNVSQRFTDRCNLTLDAGIQNLEYQAVQQNVSASRVDNYFYLRPGFSVRFTSHCSVSIYYEYSQDDSTDSAYGFQRDRLGLQLNLVF